MPPLLIFLASAIVASIGIKWYQTSKTQKDSLSSVNGYKTERLKLSHKEGDNEPTDDISYTDNSVNQHFSIASMSLALATAGTLFYLPFAIASAFGVIYTAIPIWQRSYKSFFQENRFNMIVVNSVAIAGLLVTRHYFLAALTNWLFYSGKKLLTEFQTKFQKGIIHFFVLKDIPNFVWVLKDGVELEIPLDILEVGDIVVVNAGEIIPVDGIIIEGSASIDQSLVTGDSQSLKKGIGDQVFAFTTLLSGEIYIQAEKWGKNTVAAKMAEMYAN